MRHGGAAKKCGDQDTAIDRCSWDQIEHGAAEFEQADPGECALRETELVHPLVDENRCVRELQQCTQQERHRGERRAPAFTPLERIEAARAMRDRLRLKLDIEVDGGVTAATGRQAASSGATVLVAGHFVYSHPQGKKAAIAELR